MNEKILKNQRFQDWMWITPMGITKTDTISTYE